MDGIWELPTVHEEFGFGELLCYSPSEFILISLISEDLPHTWCV